MAPRIPFHQLLYNNIVLLAICALLLSQASVPKDLPDLVKLVNASYEKLEGFRDTWELKSDDGSVVSFNRTLDGSHYHEVIRSNDADVFEVGDSGSAGFGVCYPLRIYTQTTPNPNDKTPAPEAPKPESGSFQFKIENRGFTIESDPIAKIISIKPETVGDKSVRHVIAKVGNPLSGSVVTADMIFLPNDWVLTDFKMTISKKDKPDEVNHFTCKVETGLHFDASEFSINSAKVQGFEKLPVDEFTKQSASFMGG